MYLLGSSFAETNAGSVRNQAHRSTRCTQELEVSRIRCVSESVCLYRLRCAQSTDRVVFFAPRREKPNECYLQWTPLPVVCRGFSTPLRAAHLHELMPALFARDGAPCSSTTFGPSSFATASYPKRNSKVFHNAPTRRSTRFTASPVFIPIFISCRRPKPIFASAPT